MYQGLLLMLQKIRKFSGLKLAQPVHSILLSRPSLWTLWWAYLERVMGLSVRGLFHIIPSLLKWIQPRIKTCVKQSKISNIKGMIHCTPYSLLPNDRQRDVVCRKDTPRGVFSIRYVWNSIHPVQNNVEWWHLFGTNRRSCDSSSSYGLLFVKHYWLEIGLCPLVSFRFHGLYYVGMIVRILTTYFFIALSPAVSGMIFVLYASSHLGVNYETTPSHGSLIWVAIIPLHLWLSYWC
jgi:hypothetical protein